ncbi:copper homeostasis protein CutC [Dokdonia sinensis]|uniref:PF03932 family protein CutC n=1 Tax=Dokdonia sinensis TaxID=2479847 RepID=A0A3M0GJY7_9FLAO|nr:copper homeostasis protein CutC [Dokdonia sinensis]RMB62952.1 copper homeostasis protein CutC [Dokdonia sinensis]
MKLEICANSFESAQAAQVAGAHRIELCQELALGGITPSHGLIEKVVEELEIPVFVLIRPRSGDFTYSYSEFDIMLRDIAFAKAVGCRGIVSGMLNSDFTIDVERTQKLVTASSGMDFTFHRAFDWTLDYNVAIQTLKGMGINRILTSGQETNVDAGFEKLVEMKNIAGSDFSVMPGGGVNSENIVRFKEASFTEVHASASSFRQSLKHHIPMHNTADLDKDKLRFSDVEKIRGLLKFL